MNDYQRSLIQLHGGVLLFGGTSLFSHLLPWSALDITMLRTAIAALALMLIIKYQGDRLRLNSGKDYLMALLLGLIVGAHWVTYFMAMQLSNVAIGMLAFFCYPVVTVFLEPLFNKTRAHQRDILCALAVFVGVYLLIPELDVSNDTTLGIAIGVFSGFLFALRNVLHKRYFSHYKGTQAMFYQTLVVAIMLSPFLELDPLSMSGLVVDGKLGEFGLLLLLSVVFTALPHSFLANSLKNLSAKTAGLISCLQPLYGVVLAALILGQWPSSMVYIGGALIVMSAVFETIAVTKGSKKTR
ncbi:MAG: EamA family transporter [Gammaproteobacteria bacterium]|nr:EamA family transporter [Gammaproteobacteria bacterium]